MQGSRIRQRRKQLKLTQRQVANSIGVTAPTVVQWEAGDTKPNGSNLLRLAEVLATTPEWISSGRGPSAIDLPEENAVPVKKPLSKVPLISWVQAGLWFESPDIYHPGDAEEWLLSPFKHGPHAYCLRVAGDSMMPEYRDGEIILVDPDTEARHNSDIVVRTPDPDPRQLFKRLQITPEGTYLLALNPDHAVRIIEMPAGSRICGVVVGSWMARR